MSHDTNHLEPFDLGGGVTAYISKTGKIGEAGTMEFCRLAWAPAGDAWSRSSRVALSPMVACIRQVDGLPDGLTWPALPWELTPESPELDERFNLLRHPELDLDMSTIPRFVDTMKKKLTITEDEEKKPETS